MNKYVLIILLVSGFVSAQQININSRYQLAREYELKNDLEKAKEIFEQLRKEDPNNPIYFNDLRDIYTRTGEFEKSIKLINEFLKLTPGDINLYGQLGDTYFKMGNRDEAFRIWKNALKVSDPSNLSHRIISNYIIQNRAYDEAIEILKEGRELSGRSDLYTMDIAHLYAITMQFENSAREYCELLLRQPEQISAVQGRIDGYLRREENIQQITNTIEEFYEDHHENAIASLLSHVYKNVNNYQRAYEIDFELDKATNAKGQIVFRFAQEAFRDRAFSAAAKAYKYIIDEERNLSILPNSYLGYANAREMELNDLISKNRNWKYETRTDTSLFQQYRDLINEYTAIDKLFNRQDIISETNYRIGIIYSVRLNQPAEAEKYFTRSITSFRNSRFALMAEEELAKIHVLNGRLEAAMELLNNILKSRTFKEEELNRIRLLKAKIYFWKKDFKNSLNLLNELVDNKQDDSANDGIELTLLINAANKDSISLSRIAEADFWRKRGKYSEAAEIYNAVEKTPGLFYLSDYAGIKYVEMLLFDNQIPLAISTLEKITKKEMPGIFADKALFLLAEIYNFAVQDYEKAARTYENFLDKYPGSIYLERARESLVKINSRERNNS